MLSLPPSVRLFMATQPVDGRKGPDSLMSMVREVFAQDPLTGHLFIFFSRRCERVRIVYWDRNGYAMWTSAATAAGAALEDRFLMAVSTSSLREAMSDVRWAASAFVAK